MPALGDHEKAADDEQGEGDADEDVGHRARVGQRLLRGGRGRGVHGRLGGGLDAGGRDVTDDGGHDGGRGRGRLRRNEPGQQDRGGRLRDRRGLRHRGLGDGRLRNGGGRLGRGARQGEGRLERTDALVIVDVEGEDEALAERHLLLHQRRGATLHLGVDLRHGHAVVGELEHVCGVLALVVGRRDLDGTLGTLAVGRVDLDERDDVALLEIPVDPVGRGRQVGLL